MRLCLAIFIFIFKIFGAHSLVVPDEITSAFFVIINNIPKLQKGTDSRFGWGFRLGDRADFQILTELGPQKFTQPLYNQRTMGNSKRSTLDSLSDGLYAQSQNIEGRKWLENWSNSGQKKKESDRLPSAPRPGTPEDSALELKSKSSTTMNATLYQEKNEKIETTTQEIKKTTEIVESKILKETV
ncbi:hypothetical protein BDFB_008067 [Asbolus verrucosus]|uniref:Uncharacterized protein n=1 Tax=Asbolus verrucosus TaxID=1661398 RepID=A0A482VNA2_ASBVE|nr:hypothetical protein BDFB_008067 [Asbolus verrucosus]